jgi:hypothetical protein
VRGICKQDAIKRTRLKLIQIATLQDKALATERPKMRDGWLVSKAKLKEGQMQDQAQENLIGDITCSADSIGPKASKSSMLNEHHPSHLN